MLNRRYQPCTMLYFLFIQFIDAIPKLEATNIQPKSTFMHESTLKSLAANPRRLGMGEGR